MILENSIQINRTRSLFAGWFRELKHYSTKVPKEERS